MRPTAPTCGSVKITRGDAAPSERSAHLLAENRVGGEPRLVLPHVREQRAAVDVADRVEPVVARHPQRLVDARRACPVRARPSRARASVVRGVRPIATSSSSASTVSPSSSSTRTDPFRETRSPRSRDARRPRRRAAPSSTCSLANGSSRSIRRSPRCTSVTLRPERRPGLRHLDADDAAAEHEEPSGHLLRGRRLDVRPRRGVREPRHRRDRRRAARRDHHRATRGEHVVADLTRRSPSSRPWPRTSVDAALLEPRQHRAVVEVVDDLVAAGQHRGDVELARLATPGHATAPRLPARPAGGAPSTACTRRRSTRRRRAAPRRWRPRDPASPSRPATTSPGAPAPITTTSNSRSLHVPPPRRSATVWRPSRCPRVGWARAEALGPPRDGRPGDRSRVRRAAAPASRLAPVPRRSARGRGASRPPAAAPGRRRDVDPVRDARPARVDGPRPGVPHRAPRGWVSRPLRNRRRRGVRRRRAARWTSRHIDRGETLYAPDENARLYPPALSEGAASLLPDQTRPALVWTMDVDETGEGVDVDVRHALVRSRREARLRRRAAATRRRDGRRALRLLREVGHPPAAARSAPRRRQPRDLPEQVITEGDGRLRARLPRAASRRGLERPDLADDGYGGGRADAERQHRPSAHGPASPTRTASSVCASRRRRCASNGPTTFRTRSSSAALSPFIARQAALLVEAGGLLRGSGYTWFEHDPPERPGPLRARVDVRPHDRPAPQARRPVRRRGVHRALSGRGGPGVGPRRAADAAGGDGEVGGPRGPVRGGDRVDRRGRAARTEHRRHIRGDRRRAPRASRRSDRRDPRARNHRALHGRRPPARRRVVVRLTEADVMRRLVRFAAGLASPARFGDAPADNVVPASAIAGRVATSAAEQHEPRLLDRVSARAERAERLPDRVLERPPVRTRRRRAERRRSSPRARPRPRASACSTSATSRSGPPPGRRRARPCGSPTAP